MISDEKMNPLQQRKLRYQQIMARIERHDREKTQAVSKDELSKILDEVGAISLLETYARSAIEGWYGYGPKVRQAIPEWVGVIGWWRRSSFYAYESIQQLGIWSRHTDTNADETELLLGVRELAFKGSFHNPESLHIQLQHDYRIYYVGEDSPPEKTLFHSHYEASQRLSLRLQLGEAIRNWAEALVHQASRQ